MNILHIVQVPIIKLVKNQTEQQSFELTFLNCSGIEDCLIYRRLCRQRKANWPLQWPQLEVCWWWCCGMVLNELPSYWWWAIIRNRNRLLVVVREVLRAHNHDSQKLENWWFFQSDFRPPKTGLVVHLFWNYVKNWKQWWLKDQITSVYICCHMNI